MKKYNKIILVIAVVLGILIMKVNNKKTFIMDNINYSVYLDGASAKNFPSKGSYKVEVTCTNATGSWDYGAWQMKVTDITGVPSCDANFTSLNDSNKIFLNTHVVDLVNTTQGTGQVVNENGYRYEGFDPKNYVWFNNDYWRIIGVFDTLLADGTTKSVTKIIKMNDIGGYVFDNSTDLSSYGSNAWLRVDGTTKSASNNILNDYYNAADGTGNSYCYSYSGTISNNCNFTKTGIQDGYRNMIVNATWYLGGYSSMAYPVATWYGYERGSTRPSNNQNALISNNYIALMYPSDYGYSVLSSSCSRSTNLSSYNTSACGGSSWLYGKSYQWTLSPFSSHASYVWNVNYTGNVDYSGYVNDSNASNGYVIRPTLYLNSSVYIVSGDGSYDNPYVVNM